MVFLLSISCIDSSCLRYPYRYSIQKDIANLAYGRLSIHEIDTDRMPGMDARPLPASVLHLWAPGRKKKNNQLSSAHIHSENSTRGFESRGDHEGIGSAVGSFFQPSSPRVYIYMPYSYVRVGKRAKTLTMYTIILFIMSLKLDVEPLCKENSIVWLLFSCSFLLRHRSMIIRVNREYRIRTWDDFDRRFNEAECWQNFRFWKKDIRVLVTSLELPEDQTLRFSSNPNVRWGVTTTKIEMLLVILKRLSSPGTYASLIDFFGLTQPELSLIFKVQLWRFLGLLVPGRVGTSIPGAIELEYTQGPISRHSTVVPEHHSAIPGDAMYRGGGEQI